MMQEFFFGCRVVCLTALFAALSSSLALAQSQSAARVTQPIDDKLRVTLKGNVHPLAQPRYDQGAVPDSFAAERMLLLLQRSPQQEFALRQFLQDAQTPSNASYHQWLKPEDFGRLYGPADADIAGVTTWLQSHGFTVARVTKGKTAIEFSGNAGQIRAAFGAEIHTYLVNGETHHANNRDPEVPAALAPVAAGVTSLNDFRPKSYAEVLGEASYNPATHQAKPEWTIGPIALALAPGDFAVQYDLNPVYSAGTNGAGVTIGIIGASNVDPAVVATYRAFFGLPAVTLNIILDGTDPGNNGAVVESYLDVELAGAVAPGATINLYTALDTALQFGLNLAAQRAVDDDVAPVLSTSYGNCEQNLGSAGNLFWAAVWEQAAAQGQTSFVSSGDGGSAGCDNFDITQPAQLGLAVSGIASTPWNISVGGTDFFYTSYNAATSVQNAQLATYWNLTPSGVPSTSLMKPVPEQVWNNAFGLNLATGGVFDPNVPTIVAGSGGASSCSSGVESAGADSPFASCTSGYAKPPWQTGTGVPADGVRDLPDVSLYAANGANSSFYPICASSEDCVTQNGSGFVTGVGGTSASSPAMAGIMALINQKYGAQGQANFTLYPLAAQHATAFHDVTVGSNNVPCQPGTPSCAISTLTDNTNGFDTLGHYYAAGGYDLASGLGSVDANLLVKFWKSLTFKTTETTLALSQTTFKHGTPVNIAVGVTGSGGTPSGDVALVSTATPSVNTGLGELTLQSGAASAALNNLPGGQYTVTARYAGDALFAASTSSPMTLNVSPEASITAIFGNYFNFATRSYAGFSNGGSLPYGSYITIDARPLGVNAPHGSTDGIATGAVTFTDAASTGQNNSGAILLNSTGVAEWLNTFDFLAGTHSLTARYSGDASFNASSSATPFTFTITKAVSTVSLSAFPASVGVGTPTALTMLVIATDFAPPPTGNVTFNFGGAVLGTVPLGQDPFNPHVAQATLNTSSLPLGTDAVTATYNGDSNCNPATSSAFTITVKQEANLAAVLTPNPFNEAQSFSLTISVTGGAGLPVPTGGVGLFADSHGASYGAGATLVNGSATITGDGNFLNLGNSTFFISYNGDSTYAPANTIIQAAETLPFNVSGTPVAIAAAGATTGNTSTVMVSPLGGFTGAVSLSCLLATSPAGAKFPPGCSVPASVTIAGASAVTATMTISSTAGNTSAFAAPLPSRTPWLAASVGASLFGIVIFAIPSQGRRQRYVLSLVFVLAMVGGLAACGGGGNGGGGGGGRNSGTTPGSYTLVVTATTPGPNAGLQTVSASASVTVTIQ
jgi:hypothetical protein